MDSSLLRFLYFIALIPLNWLAFHWLWTAILDSAGWSRAEAWKKRAGYDHQPAPSKHFTRRLIYDSKNPKETRRLLGFYSFGVFPIFLCVALSFLGLQDAIFDTFLRWAAWIMPVIVLMAWICGLIHRRRQKQAGITPPPRNTLLEDWKALKRTVYDPEYQKQLAQYGGSKAKMLVWGIVKLVLALAILAGLLFLAAKISTGPNKDVVSPEEMKAAMEAYHGDVVDGTPSYAEAWQAEEFLQSVLVADDGDFHFEYVMFTDQTYASSLWTQYQKIMDAGQPDATKTQQDWANYRIVTLQSGERYEVLVQVENTVVRAYSNREESYRIREILMKTGYYDED